MISTVRGPMATVSAASLASSASSVRREPVAGEGQVLELLDVGQPAGAVVLEDELVALHHVAAADDVLG